MRVVLYAEGAGEEGTAARMAPAPGTVLQEEWLGPAHELVRRCLEEADGSARVHFESPLRLRGQIARGSMLKDWRKVRRLLTWPRAEFIPDIVVVLVDADGDHQVRNRMQDCISDPQASTPVIIGVAVQEFESWLVADTACVSHVAQRTTDSVPDPESMSPRDCKIHLQEALSQMGKTERVRARRRIAVSCDLDQVERRCPSFERFRKDLRRAGGG